MMSLGTFFNPGAKRASHLQRRSGLQSFKLRKKKKNLGFVDQTKEHLELTRTVRQPAKRSAVKIN